MRYLVNISGIDYEVSKDVYDFINYQIKEIEKLRAEIEVKNNHIKNSMTGIQRFKENVYLNIETHQNN
jgi:hypothetical protein